MNCCIGYITMIFLAEKIRIEDTPVDMLVCIWTRVTPFVLGTDAWNRLPYVKSFLDAINAHPAAQRVKALKTQFVFKTEVDEDARRMLFSSNERFKLKGV